MTNSMPLSPFFKGIIDEDLKEVVICDLTHTIIYMNPAAALAYEKEGGYQLIGTCLFDCHLPSSVEKIKKIFQWFLEDSSHNRIHTMYSTRSNTDIYMVAIRDEDGKLIGYYEKHEARTQDDTPFYQMN